MLLAGTVWLLGSKSGSSGEARRVRFEMRDMHGPLFATIRVARIAIKWAAKRSKDAWACVIECEEDYKTHGGHIGEAYRQTSQGDSPSLRSLHPWNSLHDNGGEVYIPRGVSIRTEKEWR
jgi:hypothetical protein